MSLMPSFCPGGLVPTTWNPADKNALITLSNGNLTATAPNGSTGEAVRSIFGTATGKYYWEITVGTVVGGSTMTVGVGYSTMSLNNFPGRLDANGFGYAQSGAIWTNNNGGAAYGSSYTTADIIGIALDMAAGKIWFSKNGTYQNSGDPVGGTNPAFTGLSGTIYAAAGCNDGFSWTANFGASSFNTAAPSGYSSGFGAN